VLARFALALGQQQKQTAAAVAAETSEVRCLAETAD